MTDVSVEDAAIYAFRRNVVVAASAGTGKTHRLTGLYVLLTLGLTSMGQRDGRTQRAPILPERIVATTFSRAAAREIARRVEDALRAIAASETGGSFPFEDVIEQRSAELGEALSPKELASRARTALSAFPKARIDTLHGIARRIVRGHALALGIPAGARVLEEDELQALGDLSVDEALGEALERGGAAAQAARGILAASGGALAARQKIVRLLDRLDEEGIAPLELAVADHLAEARLERVELFRVAKGVSVAGSSVFRDPARALTGALAAALDDSPFPLSAIAPAVELLTTRMPQRSSRTPADEELAAFRDARRRSDTLEETAVRMLARLIEAPRLSSRERAALELVEDARQRFALAKLRASGLGFGNLLRGARDGLLHHPEVASSLRGGIDALLVDEFQDTSRVQRDLVYLLREREDAARPSGAAPTAAGLAPHGLFLVGDRKQSIYGFRGADVGVFARVAAELGGAAAELALAMPVRARGDALADFVALTESRRSGEKILAFVNAFAAQDFGAEQSAEPRDFEIVYGPGEQLAPVPSKRGQGSVVLIADDGRSPEGAPPLVREATGVARAAHLAAAAVRDEIGAGHAAFRDIAVLARRRSSIPFVELALARLDVPYIVAGRALYDAPEVRDVAALLRLVLDPRDRLALATVLRGPMVALSEASLAKLSAPGRGLSLRRDRGSSLAAADLDPLEAARLASFRARFGEVWKTALRLPPGEGLRAAIRAMDLDRVLAALPRPEARIGNLDRLVAIARRRSGTLAAFSRWLDRRIKDDSDEPEAAVFSADDDAVRLTTIHGSKGLAFPVVVLLDLNAEPRSEASGFGFCEGSAGERFWFMRHFCRDPSAATQPGLDGEHIPVATSVLRLAQTEGRARDVAERKRLTYVAMTRAERRLVLVGTAEKSRANSAFRTLEVGLGNGSLAPFVTETLSPETLLAERGPLRSAPAKVPEPLGDDMPPRSAESAKGPRVVSVATTPFGMFVDCPRRYRLRHVLGFEEPLAPSEVAIEDDTEPPDVAPDELLPEPRALGRAAHRVLERWPFERWGESTDPSRVIAALSAEGLVRDAPDTRRIAASIAGFLGGAYARRIREEGARIHREESFVLPIQEKGGPGVEPNLLFVRGTIDLLAVHPDGSVDVIDYKLSSRPFDLSPYAFQLRLYALSAERAFPGANLRTGLVFLGTSEEPTWISRDSVDGFTANLSATARALVEARLTGRFEPVARARCEALRCGFLPACHGEAKPPEAPQLGLFDLLQKK